MKIQIASDLHLELRRNHEPELHDFYPVEDRDLLVLAGDIGAYMNAWGFIEEELRRSPVIYVPGNHEYYSWQTREHIDAAWKHKAKQNPDLHYLDRRGRHDRRGAVLGRAVVLGPVQPAGSRLPAIDRRKPQ